MHQWINIENIMILLIFSTISWYFSTLSRAASFVKIDIAKKPWFRCWFW